MSADESQERLSEALFGEDHCKPTEYAMCSVGMLHSGGSYAARAGTACSISVGNITALSRKGGTAVPNEDCLYAYDDGRYAIHVVADGHHGHEASHDLIEAIGAVYDDLGPTLDPLEVIEEAYRYHLGKSEDGEGRPLHPLSPQASRTTLLIACLDRKESRLQGISMGDSAVFLGSVGRGVVRLDRPNQSYVALWDYESLRVPPAHQFSVSAPAGHWLLTCTDGVTECHYGKPATSISPAHLETLLIRAGGDPDRLVEAVSKLALSGVNGHPGGEDNFALLASLA